MRYFSERNPFVIGVLGIAASATAVAAALQYDKLPFVSSDIQYAAYFAEAGGLLSGAAVQVSGVDVGKVSSIDLDGPRVLVTFKIHDSIALGDHTEAAIKTKSLLGTKLLEVIPRGERRLTAPIPLERTRSPYQLPDAIGDLTTTISGLDTAQLSQSLQALADTFRDTPPELKAALDGLARFSQTLDTRDDALRHLLADANNVSTVLADRSNQIATLIVDTDAILAQLHTDSDALEHIAANISGLSRQLGGFIADNRTQLRPMLDKVNGVLTIIDNRKQQVQKTIKLLGAYYMSLGEVVSGAPFFKAYIANILPGQLIQPFVDAAFSDLGLDPNVLLPSQRTEPPTGQPGTPALPMPFPRTGQGGPPNLTLPDAITGNPGDPRYPYRPSLPGPPPGGPPPGPPAVAPPGLASTPTPMPSPVYHPAPGELPAASMPGAPGTPSQTAGEGAGQ